MGLADTGLGVRAFA